MVSALVIFSLCSGKMYIFDFPFLDFEGLLEVDGNWTLDKEGPAWRKEDEVEGRPWPKVGDDEEDTATSESLGLFGDTSQAEPTLEAEASFIASCVQKKIDFKSLLLILHYKLVTPHKSSQINLIIFVWLIKSVFYGQSDSIKHVYRVMITSSW